MSALIAQLGEERVDLPGNVQIVAVIVTVLLLGFVIELVRRRRLVERYALLWILAALAMVVLAVWRDGLNVVSEWVGVADPVNGIFLIAFAVVFGLLLNFSVVTSRLGEEAKILAQEVARLDAELRAARGELRGSNGAGYAEADGGAADGPEAGVESPDPSSSRTSDQ